MCDLGPTRRRRTLGSVTLAVLIFAAVEKAGCHRPGRRRERAAEPGPAARAERAPCARCSPRPPAPPPRAPRRCLCGRCPSACRLSPAGVQRGRSGCTSMPLWTPPGRTPRRVGTTSYGRGNATLAPSGRCGAKRNLKKTILDVVPQCSGQHVRWGFGPQWSHGPRSTATPP